MGITFNVYGDHAGTERIFLQPEPVLDLLMADENNPRSLAFQLADLGEQFERLPRLKSQATLDREQQTLAGFLERIRQADSRALCQVDGAHSCQIACLRSVGLAARYASGYLQTLAPANRERLIGADASHASVSIYCPGTRWIDLDPTNNLFPPLVNHTGLGARL